MSHGTSILLAAALPVVLVLLLIGLLVWSQRRRRRSGGSAPPVGWFVIRYLSGTCIVIFAVCLYTLVRGLTGTQPSTPGGVWSVVGIAVVCGAGGITGFITAHRKITDWRRSQQGF